MEMGILWRPHVWIVSGDEELTISLDSILEADYFCELCPAMHWAYDLLELQYPHTFVLSRGLGLQDGDGPYECALLRQRFGREFGIIGIEPEWQEMHRWRSAGADEVILERGHEESLLHTARKIVSSYSFQTSLTRNRFG